MITFLEFKKLLKNKQDERKDRISALSKNFLHIYTSYLYVHNFFK